MRMSIARLQGQYQLARLTLDIISRDMSPDKCARLCADFRAAEQTAAFSMAPEREALASRRAAASSMHESRAGEQQVLAAD